jgi:predicted small lipoprotein YifL
MVILNVNPTFILLLRAISIVAISASVLDACGQRGPLYLPNKAEPAISTQAQPAGAAVTVKPTSASK